MCKLIFDYDANPKLDKDSYLYKPVIIPEKERLEFEAKTNAKYSDFCKRINIDGGKIIAHISIDGTKIIGEDVSCSTELYMQIQRSFGLL